ncbi:MAG: CerR family C-terminal domain-containing protein [Methylacidiphilales bacterium]|nr:CerR family C-terminal domain-containing protein [Candidatus Methylacidiphilales bacterium]
MKRRPPPEQIKDRIVQTAGEVFGRYGFHGTTIRQITQQAGVNVAAVNYYFRDKAELYVRVLREAKCWTRDVAISELSGPPEERLRSFILAFVRNLLNPERPLWHVQVITQEMLHPTPALEVLLRELTEPIFRQVRSLVAEIAGKKLSRLQLDLLASSILGQCLFYVRSRPMIERLAPELSGGAHRIDRIAGHIASFSLAAMRDLFGKKNQPARSRATSRP